MNNLRSNQFAPSSFDWQGHSYDHAQRGQDCAVGGVAGAANHPAQGGGDAAVAPLVPIAKSPAISDRLQESRRQRYALQSQSRDWLKNTKNPKGKPWRVVNCHHVIAGGVGVSLRQSNTTGRARYGNLQTCGSSFTCPVCGAPLSEYRADEIRAAMNLHTAAGGYALMVTFTHGHSANDRLADLIAGEQAALASMTATRAFKLLKQELGWVGAIRAREATYGFTHGWHPHLHDAWFVSAKPTAALMADVEERLFQMWFKACKKAGLPLPNREHGVSVKHAFSPQDYIAKFGHDTKWGTPNELTKANSKRGREERYTPFDLLRGDVPIDPAKARELWREYATATYGTTQISWSRGFKAAMRVAEVSDQQIVGGEVNEESHSLVGMLTPVEWRAVLKAKARAQVLEAVEHGGWSAVQDTLARIQHEHAAAETQYRPARNYTFHPIHTTDQLEPEQSNNGLLRNAVVNSPVPITGHCFVVNADGYWMPLRI